MSNTELVAKSYEVIIIGAGPAGSYTASKLASDGYSVAVLERKKDSGLDICCTGIISTECFDSLGVNSDIIFRRPDSARLFFPSGRSIKLQSEKVKAAIVDRSRLNQALAKNAQDNGAVYYFSIDCNAITIEKNKAVVETLRHGSRQFFNARAVVLATGQDFRLHHKLGLGKFKHFAIGVQAEVEAANIDEVEVYFSQQIAPGFFSWLVPTSPGKALAGLLSSSHARLYLERFLLSPFCNGRLASSTFKIRQKLIPLHTLPHSSGERLLVVGDAAGQVKPTTGGGIYFGNLGAKIASDVLKKALDKDNLSASYLSQYQKRWEAEMGREITFGRWLRWIYGKLSDRQIERLLSMLTSRDMSSALLNSADFSFDWHSRLFLSGLKYSLSYPLQKFSNLSHRGENY
jgi:digeranylgeranylglycerophospholipid reductase